MKWKITSRFFIAIVATIICTLLSFMLINIVRIQTYNKNSQGSTSFRRGGDFTVKFGDNIQFKDGEVFIEEDKIEELKKQNNWIQVLDENGTEIYSRLKPVEAPNHYTPGKLIFYHRYSGAIEGYTIFLGILDREGRELSYIIGFPESKITKTEFYFSPETIMRDLVKVFAMSIVAILIITLVIGYVFSSYLSEPIVGIIEGIEELDKGDYDKNYTSDSIYKKVYESLNSLSITLKKSKLERENLEKMRQEWITNITHDIKTPLASIRGYSEVLLDESYNLSKDETQKYTEIIRNKSNYISDVVEDLKLTYELNKSGIGLKRKEENLVELLRDTIINILNHPKYQHREIEFESNKEEIIYSCDSMLMIRAFSNLIYNAIIHNEDQVKIKVNLFKEKDIRIEIQDNGKGIGEEDLERLFDRYYRGTNTGEAHKGSGLGMAIVKQIVEAHGGEIEVKSELGKGTVVKIIFD